MAIKLKSCRIKDADLIRKIYEISGQDLSLCMQCGCCSGSCPMLEELDLTPRKIMRMAQLGLIDRLMDLSAYWHCASCLDCSTRCPRGVELPRVMEALRQITLRQNKNRVEPNCLDGDQVADLPQIALVSGFRKLTA